MGEGFFLRRFALSLTLVFFSALTIIASANAQAQANPGNEATQSTLPLVPTRHVRFDTDEGTWINVDVSPDGSRMAELTMPVTAPLSGAPEEPHVDPQAGTTNKPNPKVERHLDRE